TYSWQPFDEDEDGVRDYYGLMYVYFCSNVTSPQYQYLNFYVPAGYLTVDEDGNVTGINEEAEINGYTSSTAPVIFQNECSGWNSSTPIEPGGWSSFKGYTDAGMVYLCCGARSRDDNNGGTVGEDYYNDGKAPAAVVDLKAGVMFLRANTDSLPGDMEHIFSIGTSGGGQMSSILGASGNMEEYYPYLYEIGAVGMSYDEATDTYSSEYEDSVFGCQAFCPIADIGNADLAYAWMHYDDGITSYSGGDFSEFQLSLQEDMAESFCEYINSLNLTDGDGNALTFDENEDGTLNPRSGSYYDAVLANMASALGMYLDATEDEEADAYVETLLASNDETGEGISQNEDGSFTISDMANYINAAIYEGFNTETKETYMQSLGAKRNKDIPGFDTFWATGEGNVFGYSDQDGVHFSVSVATLLEENYDKYAALDGFGDQDVDEYINAVLYSEDADYVANQVYLMNATQILLDDAAGTQDSTIAQYWRTRNGTADEHTSFAIAYDIATAAQMAGAVDVDYSLVWAMTHGSNEGTTTGTFTEWVDSIMKSL
ncbi:MAG: hypothetical protein LUF30_09660, partial [Lachnospiraceae bacterium]|nr:hypothetical protein [Lachnospiraceae bacterium]